MFASFNTGKYKFSDISTTQAVLQVCIASRGPPPYEDPLQAQAQFYIGVKL